MRHIISTLMISTALAAPALADDMRDDALDLFKALPSTVPAVAGNPITPTKIELGKMLFFDPRLSASGVFSCNSCHNLTTGGDDNLETSIGHGWQKGPRNSPTVLNAVLNEAQFWDGRAADLADQAKGPIQAGVEMAKAIEAFEATLLTPAPFDAWLNGDDAALDAEQLADLGLFIDKGCVSCHSGVNVGGHGYYPFGLIEKPGGDILPEGDKGRFAVTETADDEYVFRASPLRNITETAPDFHSGKVWDLKVAVQIMVESQLGEELSDTETGQIVAFLGSLTGPVPAVTVPSLPAETATTPRPSEHILPGTC